MLLDVKRVGCVGARRLGAMMLGAMMLVPLMAGCRGGDTCVPVSRTVTGEPRTKYDEFTQISWLTSWFVLTPDSEWERWRQEPEVPIRWSIEMWFRGASNVPYIDLTLRALCSHRQSEAKEAGCVNCDNLCTAENGWLEFLADGVPVHMPKARYERVPIGAPEQGGPKTWASTISLRLSPQALAPLERAQTVKMRVCGALPVTLRAGELANLQEYLRHHHAIAPPEAPPAPGGPVKASVPPPMPESMPAPTRVCAAP